MSQANKLFRTYAVLLDALNPAFEMAVSLHVEKTKKSNWWLDRTSTACCALNC